MLAVVAPLVAMYDEARAAGIEVPDAAYDDLLGRLDWIDDDKGTIDVTVDAVVSGEPVASANYHFVIPRGGK